MKKHLSVLMLFVRSSILVFLLILLIMTAAETLLFALAFRSANAVYGLDAVLEDCRLAAVFSVCLCLLCAALALPGCNFGGRQSYTLSRLRVSRLSVFFWQSVCNAGFLIILWAAQLAIALAFCAYYTSHYPQPQAAMLSFYSNTLLSNLLPLADNAWPRLMCTILLFLCLAAALALIPLRLGRGIKPLAAPMLLILTLFNLNRSAEGVAGAIILSLLALTIISTALYGLGKEARDEKKLYSS